MTRETDADLYCTHNDAGNPGDSTGAITGAGNAEPPHRCELRQDTSHLRESPTHPTHDALNALGSALLDNAVTGLAHSVCLKPHATVDTTRHEVDTAHVTLVNLDAMADIVDTLDDIDLRLVLDTMLADARARLRGNIRKVLFERPVIEAPCEDPDCWLDGLPAAERDAYLTHRAHAASSLSTPDPRATNPGAGTAETTGRT